MQALASRGESPTLAELQTHQQLAKESLLEVQQAAQDKDSRRANAALKKFHEAFDLIQQAAKKPANK